MIGVEGEVSGVKQPELSIDEALVLRRNGSGLLRFWFEDSDPVRVEG
jgi:hypothetical protein